MSPLACFVEQLQLLLRVCRHISIDNFDGVLVFIHIEFTFCKQSIATVRAWKEHQQHN